MTREITFDKAPDLKRIYAGAVFGGRGGKGDLPDVRAVRSGVSVDLDNLVAYSRLLGFTVRGTLPLTYPHMLAFPLQMVVMSQRDYPLPLMGSVHIENVITQTRPIRVEETLDVAVGAENLRPHRRGRQVDLVSEASVDGEVVWRGVSTYLSRGKENADAVSSEPPSVDELRERPGGSVWRLGDGTGRSYAAVSGDYNPIHLYGLTAKPLGFPSAIAHGMYTYARTIAALDATVPDSGVTSRVWFRKPVHLPSTVRLRNLVEPKRTLSLLDSAKRADTDHVVVENAW